MQVLERLKRQLAKQPPSVLLRICRELLARIRELTVQVRALAARPAPAGRPPRRRRCSRCPASGRSTPPGCSPRSPTSAASRTEAQLALYAGVAPLDASSGRQLRHRLNRSGNRQLNAALHMIALTQARLHAPAREYIARRRSRGQDRPRSHARPQAPPHPHPLPPAPAPAPNPARDRDRRRTDRTLHHIGVIQGECVCPRRGLSGLTVRCSPSASSRPDRRDYYLDQAQGRVDRTTSADDRRRGLLRRRSRGRRRVAGPGRARARPAGQRRRATICERSLDGRRHETGERSYGRRGIGRRLRPHVLRAEERERALRRRATAVRKRDAGRARARGARCARVLSRRWPRSRAAARAARRWSGPTGLVAAAFRHRTSAPAIRSSTRTSWSPTWSRGEDGRWSALDGRLIYAHARTAGFLYQAALRARADAHRSGWVDAGVARARPRSAGSPAGSSARSRGAARRSRRRWSCTARAVATRPRSRRSTRGARRTGRCRPRSWRPNGDCAPRGSA